MMTANGIPLKGVSNGGIESSIRISSWGISFDMGHLSVEAARVGRVLFTHAHLDHMGGVVWHCATRDLLGLTPAEYWVPTQIVEPFERMMEAWRALSGSALPCAVHAAIPGEWIPLQGRRGVRPFATVHRAPSVGYALIERRPKLRADLHDAPRERLLALRRAGLSLTEEREAVVLAYTGDTEISALDEPLVQAAESLLVEVTFLDARVTVERARERGHIHLDELLTRPPANRELIFMHLSGRYNRAEAEAILRARLPQELAARTRLFSGD